MTLWIGGMKIYSPTAAASAAAAAAVAAAADSPADGRPWNGKLSALQAFRTRETVSERTRKYNSRNG